MKKRNIINYLQLASKIAIPSDDFDMREFWLGCIGLRTDGAIVVSKNSSVFTTDVGDEFQYIPMVHAEARVLRKLNWGSILFVARVMRCNRQYGMSKPCKMCSNLIKSKGIKKVYYTINDKCYGKWDVKRDKNSIFKIRGR